jgi:predicted RecA/RadA family phage recombinase
MKTFAYDGIRIPYTNNGGSAIASGGVVALVAGSTGFVGIAVDTIAASGGTGVLEVRRAHTLTKKSGDVFTAGQLVYWDATNSRLTTSSTGNTRAGRSDGAYASAATSATILLNQP